MAACDAAILVGGRGRRLGGVCKPLLAVDGRTILARTLDALADVPLLDGELLLVGDLAAADEAAIARVVDEAAPAVRARVRRVVDERPGEGPLAGLLAALHASTAADLLLLGGDMPTLAPAALAQLFATDAAAEVAVPHVGGRLEPLHARYRRSLVADVDAALARGERSLARFLEALVAAGRAVHLLDEATLRSVDAPLASLANVNTPADRARVGGGQDEPSSPGDGRVDAPPTRSNH